MNAIDAWWQQVSATVSQGLQITFVGMALVFLTLGLIIVALVLLRRLPGLKKPKEEQGMATNLPPETVVTDRATETAGAGTAQPQDIELAQVAAIAVALLQSRRVRRSRPKREGRTSRWKQYGRAHQLGL